MRKSCNFYKDQKSYSGIVTALYKQHVARGLSIDYDAFKFTKCVTVVVNFLGTQSYVDNKKILFRDDKEINGQTIKAIELLSATNLIVNETLPPTDAPTSEFKKGLITFVDDCQMELLTAPLSTLCKSQNGNVLFVCELKNINWPACYLRFNDASITPGVNSLQFNVYI